MTGADPRTPRGATHDAPSMTPGATPSAALEAARAHDLDVPALELDAMWSRISAETVQAKPTLLSRLRELPTPRRIGLAVGSTLLLVVLLIAVMGARGGLDGTSVMLRVGITLFGLAVLAASVFAVALRGAHQRPLGWRGWTLVAAGVAVPLALSLLPALWHDHTPTTEVLVLGCNVIGCVTGFAAAIIVWIFQRTTTPVTMRVLASAAGGGIVAFAMLQVHCPADNVEHLIVGHSLVGVLLVAAAALLLGVRHLWLRRP